MSGAGTGRRETHMAEDDGIDPALVEDILRWQRGIGPRPAVAAGDEALLALLHALTDAAEVAAPALEDDPVALRLGLVAPGVDPIVASLHELAHRLGGEL